MENKYPNNGPQMIHQADLWNGRISFAEYQKRIKKRS